MRPKYHQSESLFLGNGFLFAQIVLNYGSPYRVTHKQSEFINDFMFVHLARTQKHAGKLRLCRIQRI